MWRVWRKHSDQSSDKPSSDRPSSKDSSFGGPYKRQAVATDTPICSQIGNDILNENGSAVDAAIAAMFCLGVVSMHSSGIGGGGVMLVYNRSLQEASVIDFRETAPAQAHKDMFKGNGEKAEKGILFHFVFSEIVLFQSSQNNLTIKYSKSLFITFFPFFLLIIITTLKQLLTYLLTLTYNNLKKTVAQLLSFFISYK